MIDYGRVRSGVKPEPFKFDDYSVWVHTNIQEVTEKVGEEDEFIGYEYNMVQYPKDEFILNQAAQNEQLQNQITDTQLALCEVYELMA